MNFRLFFLFISLLFVAPIFGQQNWTLKKKEKEILVYTKDMDQSSIKQIKIVSTFNSTLSALMHLLWDVKVYPEWVPHCKSARSLKKISDRSIYYYAESSFPWPLQNRDMVAHSYFEQDLSTYEIRVTTDNVPDEYPIQKGLVRVQIFKAIWVLKPLENGKVEVSYFLHTEPSGNVPNWITNRFVDKGPVETFQKMKKLIELPKYRDSSFEFIKEPSALNN